MERDGQRSRDLHVAVMSTRMRRSSSREGSARRSRPGLLVRCRPYEILTVERSKSPSCGAFTEPVNDPVNRRS
jgi:hypothetical protein